ncbi:hypothetical protein [[Kitasatospora] papulosa]|uniref:hypothetical protein n=1 Tax=[Kitasatospora] papulosa TaxID=1464011 RepID=UPI003643B3C1
MSLDLARDVLSERAAANIHDPQAMIAAAVDLEIRLRCLVAALDRDGALSTSVAEHGPFPMPTGDTGSVAMKPEQRKAIAVQIGAVQPATDALIGTLAESVANVRNHEHPSWEDLYCMNLTSYMGERVAPVLKRLLDAETENARLRARVSELEAEAVCPSQMTTSEGTSKCAQRPGHRGDHRNGAKDHYWNNDFTDASRDRRSGADAARRMIRDRQTAEDPHDSPLHHAYAVSRDLPAGGAL